jgi:16S rRNA (guanine1516-N2)-methyltransferase
MVTDPRFVLEQHDGRLQLRATERPGYGAVFADWTGAELKRRIAGGRKQALARAVGLRPQLLPTVLDATAGLGRDGFTLAALGLQVTLAERHPAVAALLRDAHRRALATTTTAFAETAGRIEIIEADTHTLVASARRWDTVYLDPMYPDDGKSALPGKEMQILRDLTGGDADADLLLSAALALARKRVVVKRPPKAPPLAAREPDASLRTTQVRFDLYLIEAS